MIAISKIFLEMPLGSQITFILVAGYLVSIGVIKLPKIMTSKKGTDVHAGCKNRLDIVSIVREGVRLYHKTIKIKYIDTLYEQMSKLEVAHINITLKMLDDFRLLGATPEDVKHYSALIYKMENSLKNYFRKWFKENHFHEKSDIEFTVYIKEKLQMIQKIITAELDDNYIGYTIPREILKVDNLEKLVPYIQEEYTKLFYEVKDISIKSKAEIAKLESSLSRLTDT